MDLRIKRQARKNILDHSQKEEKDVEGPLKR
jgi:hypothetical protein